MVAMFSAEQLADTVNAWCDQHRVHPANGQAGDRITERNIRYYRTLGLLDPPLVGGGQGFSEKHRLQLVAIRLLQAQGLPLNRIRELLFGRTLDELRRIERQGLQEWSEGEMAGFRPTPNESWGVSVLSEEWLFVSRRGRRLSAEMRDQLLQVLEAENLDERWSGRRPGERNEE